MANELDDLLNAVGLANKSIAERSGTVQKVIAAREQATADLDKSIQTQGNSNAVVTRAQGLAQMDAEAKTQKFATALGANPDDSSEIMTKLASSWRTAASEADGRLKKLDDDMQIKFLEHPLDFISAKMNFEGNVQAAEIAEKRRDSAKTSLREAQEMTQGAAVTHNALKTTVTEATLGATLDAAAAEIEGKRAQLKINTSGVAINELQSLGQMDMQRLNALSTGLSAKNQAESMEMERKRLKMQQVQFDQSVTEFNQKVADKKATKDDIKGIADTVRIGAAAAGFQNVTAMSDSKIVQMLNLKADGFQDFLKAGMKTQATGKPVVGDSAGESARIITENGAPMRPEQATVKTFLNNQWQTAANPKSGLTGGYDATKKDQVVAAATKGIVIGATKMASNIDPRDGSNIYAAPPLASVVEVPAIKNSAFYRAVLDKQMQAGGLKEFNSEQLTSLTAEAVKNKTISFNEAAVGLQAMHSAAVRINNATKGFSGLGIPEQSSFNIQLPTQLGFTRTYNMSSAQDINRVLMEKLNTGYASGRAMNPFSIN